ncbi:Coiled-coil domain-containing protein 25 [Camellia lanceoleosa]|uniref:Coiled-coil domain-containing protein 25 n=1 Tax=Camellia lanceoleosa TaxID=1840588 RepID=A0ACC0FTI8_9ERIC|nr:Coiled-coil domain-containing protein 25 [Camellia lanceoleosa]
MGSEPRSDSRSRDDASYSDFDSDGGGPSNGNPSKLFPSSESESSPPPEEENDQLRRRKGVVLIVLENDEVIVFPRVGGGFHVDKMSSAHVYVRLHKGQTIDDISEGNKVNNVDVVYTPWQNLKKTASMDVGQVGFHNPKMVRTVRVEKHINETVNRLNRTKVERKPDLKAKREAAKR